MDGRYLGGVVPKVICGINRREYCVLVLVSTYIVHCQYKSKMVINSGTDTLAYPVHVQQEKNAAGKKALPVTLLSGFLVCSPGVCRGGGIRANRHRAVEKQPSSNISSNHPIMDLRLQLLSMT